MLQTLQRYRLVALIALVGAGLSWITGSLLGQQEQRQIRQHLQHDLTIITSQIEQQLRQYSFATEWLGRELENTDRELTARLQDDASVLKLYFPALRQVLWFDQQFNLGFASNLPIGTDFIPRWDHPQLAQQLQEQPSPHARIVPAGSLSAVATDSIIIAAVEQPKFSGYLVTVLAVDDFFDSIIRDQINEGYQFEVSSDATLLYRFAGNNLLRDHWQVEQALKVFGNHWRLQLWPTQDRIDAMRSVSQLVSYWTGGALTLMAIIMVTLLQRRRRQYAELEQQLNRSQAYIEQAHQSEQQLHFLSNHDGLTELENRNGLVRFLHELLRYKAPQNQQVAVLQINLDQFRDLNYALGHPIGDDVLKRIGVRLRKFVGDEQCVARVGGDEFVLTSNTAIDEEQARQLANQVLAEIQNQIFVQGHELYCSASIGIAFASDANYDPETLLQHADSALNLARQQGFFGIAYYSPSQHLAYQQRLNLVLELRRALEAERLEIHFQPIVELRSRAIRGVESLLRIRQFDDSLLQPEQFLPLMEQTGLILPLTEKLIRTTVQHIGQWQHQVDDEFFVAINLSARQLAIPHLAELIKNYLKRYQVRPSRLQIELHEPNYMPLCEPQRQTLKKLKETGVRLAMDSFGLNQNSLTAMQYCTPHVVKINRALLSDIPTDRVKSHVVDSMLSLLQHMNLMTIAVGVENQPQIDYLLQRDCQLAQGYLLYRPLTAAQLTATLNDIATSGEANAT